MAWLGFLVLGCWLWAIWTCAEIWRGNPNYSYGWAVPPLACAFALRRLWTFRFESRAARWNPPSAVSLLLGVAAAALVFALEFARQDVWHPQFILSTICLVAVVVSFLALFAIGSGSLVRAQLFPALFFLTAIPWPARLEQPIRSGLMRWVAVSATEILQWLGVEVQTSGAALALRTGLVGITEACSGIRSLQAGIMFGLAVGEWFWLRPARRILLLAIAIAAALATNLARTLALALQAERHGIQAVEPVHDLIGTITITALIGGIWLVGKLLSDRTPPAPLLSIRQLKERAQYVWSGLVRPLRINLGPVVIAGLLGFVAARLVYAQKQAREQTQTVAFFTPHLNPAAGDRFLPVPKDIWNELHPTSGEYFQREAASLPRGVADFYHFFWEPSPWNRFALVHRPDICMPGVGWQSDGDAPPVDVAFGDRALRCYAFRFRRGNYHALQVWGVWRNGAPVPLDYNVAQILGAAEAPALEGKSRSATEIIACTLIDEESPPSLATAATLLQSVFAYQPK